MMLRNATDQLCKVEDDRFILKIFLIVGGWTSTISCLLGILTNAFSIVVLGNRMMRDLSTNIYLIALAVVNLLWLFLFLIFYALRFIIVIPFILPHLNEDPYNAYNQFFLL